MVFFTRVFVEKQLSSRKKRQKPEFYFAKALFYAWKFFPRIAETFLRMPSATSGLFIE
jgi:hypothetical protein